jgi:hypothetical protein
MSEVDYKTLKDFIRKTQEVAAANDKIEEEANELIVGLRGALDVCKEREKQWKTNAPARTN